MSSSLHGRYDVIVIGAGASGLMAALEASKRGATCLVLEAGQEALSKFLASPKQLCQLSPAELAPTAYQGQEARFTEPVLQRWGSFQLQRYWAELGLATRIIEGALCPYSQQSRSVVQVLLAALRSQGTRIQLNSRVERLLVHPHLQLERNEVDERYSVVLSNGQIYQAASVVLATGGMAAPALGSDGSGYQLYTSNGHRLVRPRPALVPLVLEGVPLSLAGLSLPVGLTVEADQEAVYRSVDEVTFTDSGLTGKVILNFSNAISEGMNRGKVYRLLLDFLPDQSEEEALQLVKRVQRYQADSQAPFWGISYLPERLSMLLYEQRYQDLIRARGFKPRSLKRVDQVKFSDLDDSFLRRLIQLAKQYPFRVLGTKGFGFAQACSGGLATSEFNAYTMQSLKHAGLFACGEVLDVLGPSGGYNLHWAFASGLTAGQQAAMRRI